MRVPRICATLFVLGAIAATQAAAGAGLEMLLEASRYIGGQACGSDYQP